MVGNSFTGNNLLSLFIKPKVSFMLCDSFRKASPNEIREEYERLQREKVINFIQSLMQHVIFFFINLPCRKKGDFNS